MEVGNIEIKKYLSQFWNPSHELQNQFRVNSNQTQAAIALSKIKGLELMVQGLLKYILSGYISPKEQLNIDQIFAKLGTTFDFKGQECKLLFAFSVKQQIFKNSFLQSLQKKIIEVFQSLDNDSSFDQYSVDFDDTINSKDQEKKIQQIPNCYANQKESDMVTQSESHERSNTTIVIDFDENQDVSIHEYKEDEDNFNSDYFKVENEQVRIYLNKLSKSTTELSYLCQRMKWSQPEFKEQKSKINEVLYACTASVNVRIKNSFLEMSNICSGAVSKKEAKRVAALFLLRKIYNRIPDAWTKFEDSKKKNPMIQLQLNANNQQIFKKEKFYVMENSVFKEEEQKPSSCQISTKINKYLDQIKSYKSEMNLIIGKFKKISPPEIKPQKQDALSLWPVETQIFDEDGTKLHFYAKEMSKKKAEQTCCRQLLFQLFKRNIPRWEQFKKYKKQKSLN